MARPPDIADQKRRLTAATRLGALFRSFPDDKMPGRLKTKKAFAERFGFNQSRFGRWSDVNSDSPGTFDVRVAIEFCLIDEIVFPGEGRSVYWWLAVDAMIEAWPSKSERDILKRIHSRIDADI